ncbi:hypothetical protein RCIA190 [Methanocella arvoryzae MRE50]|uniref:Uncharacterized protein n=1 Tax=Methanocella arvoryzae (strain DSM 22066 / NBRC 105507 / MRE50) TaxID=351160 RepID=Q0W1T6_METAR|nr:hypothetical protein RCIA190 [Methanocella arvoryzae MRE50]
MSCPFPPTRAPASVSCPRLACSLPGLCRSPQSRQSTCSPARRFTTANPAGRIFNVEKARPSCVRKRLPRASSSACRRFRITGDAESPGLARQTGIFARARQ